MRTFHIIIGSIPRFYIACLLASILLAGCSAIEALNPDACSLTEPEWLKPPEDDAVEGSPEFGYYYVNPDRSIWASAWWHENPDDPLSATEDGVKVGWFRPAGAELEITGWRIDGEAPPLESHVPCCYLTRFQATGLYFPSEGCWQVNARAAGSELSFVVQVEP
jgi:hypothetical protein